MSRKPTGTLIIIGGGERKDDQRRVLGEVSKHAGAGKLVVATVATEKPEETWEEYRQIFRELGVRRIENLDVRLREQAKGKDNVYTVKGAAVVFFTGGDQLKITSQLGDSPVYQTVEEIYAN